MVDHIFVFQRCNYRLTKKFLLSASFNIYLCRLLWNKISKSSMLKRKKEVGYREPNVRFMLTEMLTLKKTGLLVAKLSMTLKTSPKFKVQLWREMVQTSSGWTTTITPKLSSTKMLLSQAALFTMLKRNSLMFMKLHTFTRTTVQTTKRNYTIYLWLWQLAVNMHFLLTQPCGTALSLEKQLHFNLSSPTNWTITGLLALNRTSTVNV